MVSGVLYAVAGILLFVSWLNDRDKTKRSLRIAWKSFAKLLPTVLAMMLFVGISLSIISPGVITTLLGAESGIPGAVLGLLIGSVVTIPSFVAFPLGGALLKAGAGYMQVAALISTIIAVGLVTLPAEIAYFNKHIAVKRIVLSFMVCVVFTVVIGLVM